MYYFYSLPTNFGGARLHSTVCVWYLFRVCVPPHCELCSSSSVFCVFFFRCCCSLVAQLFCFCFACARERHRGIFIYSRSLQQELFFDCFILIFFLSLFVLWTSKTSKRVEKTNSKWSVPSRGAKSSWEKNRATNSENSINSYSAQVLGYVWGFQKV